MPFTEKQQKKLEELERAFEVYSNPQVQMSQSIGGVFGAIYEPTRRNKETENIATKIADLRARKILSEKGMDPNIDFSEFYKVRSEEEERLFNNKEGV